MIIYCPGVAWDDVKGSDVQLATALARREPVLWLDPPASAWRALRGAGIRGLRPGARVDVPAPGVTRVRTLGPPCPTKRLLRPVTELILRRALRRAVGTAGPSDVVVVSSPQPRARVAPGAAYVYYATDDFVAGAELLGIPRSVLARDESAQLRSADLVVAVSPALARPWLASRDGVHVLLNGCDAQLAADVERAEPCADVSLPRPVAGVVGQISERLDLALLEAVADGGMSLLVVGPLADGYDSERFRRLVARPGITWLGRQPYERLPSLYRAMDVGLTPYADSAFNRASVPLKTLEYVAAGLPVVTTPLPAVELFSTPMILEAAGPQEFAEAARAAAGLGGPERREWSRDFVATNSWDRRAEHLLDLAAPVRSADARSA